MQQFIKQYTPLIGFYSYCIESPDLQGTLLEVIDEYLKDGEAMISDQALLMPKDVILLENQIQDLSGKTVIQCTDNMRQKISSWACKLPPKDLKNLILMWALVRFEEANEPHSHS